MKADYLLFFGVVSIIIVIATFELIPPVLKVVVLIGWPIYLWCEDLSFEWYIPLSLLVLTVESPIRLVVCLLRTRPDQVVTPGQLVPRYVVFTLENCSKP